ncbi:hypothetical protein XELAEV_18030819mg [Xenopus laevis]|uniref:Disease resistance R13L4/SHOC-2-like LRR domain-containing protein n=1 Tax=Xenopus laevis TaxID=8355 RepID=A0A974HF39_XENLA|nr:hypothetical protein XELAEV_18030819mg [Xenopus laevis]
MTAPTPTHIMYKLIIVHEKCRYPTLQCTDLFFPSFTVTLSHITQLILSHNKLTRESAALSNWGGATAIAGETAKNPSGLMGKGDQCDFTSGQGDITSGTVNTSGSGSGEDLWSCRGGSGSGLEKASVPPNIADLKNLEVLNFFNNQIEELPTQISSLQKLKHLNLGMNRLNGLPRGFGSLPALEVLDLTYNNLNENSLSGNFFYLTTLRALYLSDNDFETLPPDIGKLTKLQIISLRDNDLISLPKEVGELTQLKELHIQGNRLTVLPPELGNLDLTGQKQVFKAENNPWVTPIADQFQVGVSHVFEYIRSETYKYLYGRHMQANPEPPKKNNDKSKKISRKPLAAKNK